MDVLRALADEIRKMFAADLWLTLAAVATVAVVATGLRASVIPPAWAPFLLGAGVLGALTMSVVRGAGR
jgi:hypothetical protein